MYERIPALEWSIQIPSFSQQQPCRLNAGWSKPRSQLLKAWGVDYLPGNGKAVSAWTRRELAFSGTEQLMKNVRAHARTNYNTGWALARMSTRASRSKGEGWALTRVPPKSLGTQKMGGGRLREHGRLPGRIRYYLVMHTRVHETW